MLRLIKQDTDDTTTEACEGWGGGDETAADLTLMKTNSLKADSFIQRDGAHVASSAL